MTAVQLTPVADNADWTSGEVTLRWPHLFAPHRFDGEAKAYYRADILIRKSDRAALTALREALDHAKARYKGEDDLPFAPLLKDGDRKMSRDGTPSPDYAGCWYFAAKTDRQPQVMEYDGQRGIIPADPMRARSSSVTGQVVVWLFPWRFEDRKGVSARLVRFLIVPETYLRDDAVPGAAARAILSADGSAPLHRQSGLPF